ncbi:MAG: hypothetical protein Q4C54_03765 [Clostridia bacterium]|nr:hypothetical protein [Clostridia bacterium]
MIYNQNPRTIFYYRYQPLTPEWRENPDDNGFALTVFEDGRAYFSLFNGREHVIKQDLYQLTDSFRVRYLEELKLADRWLGSVPQQMTLPPQYVTRFRSQIGLDGYPLIFCDDIAHLTKAPFGDEMGRCARRLCMLLEDIAELLKMQGLTLTPYGFTFDAAVARTVSSNTMDQPFTTPNAVVNY